MKRKHDDAFKIGRKMSSRWQQAAVSTIESQSFIQLIRSGTTFLSLFIKTQNPFSQNIFPMI